MYNIWVNVAQTEERKTPPNMQCITLLLWDDACLVSSLSTDTHNNVGASILAAGSGEDDHGVFKQLVGKP